MIGTSTADKKPALRMPGRSDSVVGTELGNNLSVTVKKKPGPKVPPAPSKPYPAKRPLGREL